MGWSISCNKCREHSWATNIVDLLDNRMDEDGWFLCESGHEGFIQKSFEQQEGGAQWKPYLRGAIRLGKPGEVYQPFVFLVSYEPAGPVSDVWFSYYKDLRGEGGRLKFGYGPGGPPVLNTENVLDLVSRLVHLKCISADEVLAAIEEDEAG